MKRNRIIKYIFLSSFFSLLLLGCEEVLDLKPTNAYTEEAIWESPENANAFLNVVLEGVGKWGLGDDWDWVQEGGDGVTMFPCNMTEDALQRGNHGQLTFYQGRATADHYRRATQWRWSWGCIRRANIFIENVHRTVGATEDEIAVMEAQARFIRAARYANLLEMYSWWTGENNGVMLITEVLDLSDDLLIQRDSYEDVVSFIITELDATKDVLPIKWDNSEWGRPTTGACLMLKSRVLLYDASTRHNPGHDNTKWQAASDAAKAVIELDEYSLKPVVATGDYIGAPDGTDYDNADFWQYSDIWVEPSSHTEIILAKPQDDQANGNKGIRQRSGPSGYGGEGGTCPTQISVDYYRMANGLDINDPSSGYDPNNPYVGRELRFYANIIYNGRFYYGRPVEFFMPEVDSEGVPKPGIEAGLDSRHPSANNWDNSTETSYTLYKFMDEKHTANISEKDEVPCVLMRYAEAILNYAEAQFELGNEGVARDYINMIRSRGDIPDLTSESGDALQDAIRRERIVELAFEGFHKFCDFRRWEVLDEHFDVDSPMLTIYKDTDGSLRYDYTRFTERTFSEKVYNFPIDAREIEKFPALVQNPGY